MIEYKKGSLFESAGKGVVLAQAVNALGVWGSGIAYEFSKRYPVGNKQYKEKCAAAFNSVSPTLRPFYPLPFGNKRSPLVGSAFVVEDGDRLGCLVTSHAYSSKVDPPDMIIAQTKTAVAQLLKLTDLEIHSNKFNSGLFHVPWEQTEAVIRDALIVEGKNRKWVVWDPA